MATKSNAVEAEAPGSAVGLKPQYLEAVSRVERLHRRLLDLIKDELDKCLKTEAFIREMPLFESRKEEVAAYLQGQLEHCLRRKAALGHMNGEMLKAPTRNEI